MAHVVHWAYRVGLVFGAIAAVTAAFSGIAELHSHTPNAAFSFADRVTATGALVFMCMGVVLLVSAIIYLSRSWPTFSREAKIVSVIGLFMSTFCGAYVFFWLVPKARNWEH
jgi:uncharacterized membrane protein